MEMYQMQKSWNEKLHSFHERCRQTGLKITPQRTAVYKSLIQTDMHPTAEEVFNTVRQEMPSISLDTVNRTLLTLAEIGVAFVVEGSGQPRRYDGGLEDHQHFRCLKCGKIYDFCHKPFENIEIPPIVGHFRVMRKTVYFEGYCQDCNKDN